MSAIYDHLPDAIRKILMIVITAVTGAFMVFLAWYSVEYILNLYSKGRIYPALGIPIWTTYLWVPIGFFITGIQYLLTSIKNVQEKEVYLSTNLHEAEAHEVEV